MLAEHPSVLVRLRREVTETVGPNGKVGPESIREMKYLRAVLNGDWFTTVRRLSTLICHRDIKVVSKRVCIGVLSYAHNQAEKGAAVHGISDAPKKGRFGQPSMGESQYTSRVIRRFTFCPG